VGEKEEEEDWMIESRGNRLIYDELLHARACQTWVREMTWSVVGCCWVGSVDSPDRRHARDRASTCSSLAPEREDL